MTKSPLQRLETLALFHSAHNQTIYFRRAVIAQQRVILTHSHPAAHPVYCGITPLTSGRAMLNRRSPISPLG